MQWGKEFEHLVEGKYHVVSANYGGSYKVDDWEKGENPGAQQFAEVGQGKVAVMSGRSLEGISVEYQLWGRRTVCFDCWLRMTWMRIVVRLSLLCQIIDYAD